ncbi:MAG: DUF1800 family protein [Planctomycetota bacterium]|jgi:uncharacterized protein (DUF1800 family)
MKARILASVCCASLLLAGCGGGGGGAAPADDVPTIVSLLVSTQPSADGPFGTTLGGDQLEITGSGFRNGARVNVGGKNAPVTNVLPDKITCTTPVGAPGPATVVVTNPGGASDAVAGVFSYVAPPTISSWTALTGPTAGEARVPIDGNETLELRGTNFKDGVTVTVDGIDVVVTRVSEQRLTFPVPEFSEDRATTLLVRNPEGLTASAPSGLIYTQEFSLAPARGISHTRARHLFRRAAFGATPARIDQALADGLETTVDKLINYTNDSQLEDDTVSAIYGSLTIPGGGINNGVNKDWWLTLMLRNPNGFQERLAFLLHDHFATSEQGFATQFRWSLHPQINLFRRFSLSTGQTLADGSPGLGYDWKQICIEAGKDSAMLDWLDGRQSYVNRENENYARELWELFMLGEGNGYTEDDIKEAARAFTGFFWQWDDPDPTKRTYLEMKYRSSRHDKTDKTILGETGKFGYDSLAPYYEGNPTKDTDDADTDGGIVALTLRARPVEASEFICRKLAEYFLYEDIHDSVVNELAVALRTPGANQWNLKPIIETILMSKAMFSGRAMKGKVKNPIEFVIGFLRTTNVRLGNTMALDASRVRFWLGRIGQLPIDPPDVAGWPTGKAWLGSQAMLERTNFVNYAVLQLDAAAQVDSLVPSGSGWGAAQLVDHLATHLDVTLSANARSKMIAYVNEGVGPAFDPNDPTELKMKVRGLLWLIAPYHDGHQE